MRLAVRGSITSSRRAAFAVLMAALGVGASFLSSGMAARAQGVVSAPISVPVPVPGRPVVSVVEAPTPSTSAATPSTASPGTAGKSDVPDTRSAPAKPPTTDTAVSGVVPALPDPSNWLSVVNYWRMLAGVDPVSEDRGWSAGAIAHAKYLVRNDATGHEQDPSLPGASAIGAAAAKNGDVARGYADQAKAIEGWMQAPFHAAWIVNPRLNRVGFGLHVDRKGSAAVLDVIRGIEPKIPRKVISFPGNNTSVPLTTFLGENPDPRLRCPAEYQKDSGLGLPLFTLLIEPPVTPSATLKEDGREVDVCVFTGPQTLASLNGVYLLPRNALVPGSRYDVTVRSGGISVSWTFRAIAAPSAVENVRIDTDSSPPTVRWDAPRSTGGLGLTTYTVGLLGRDGLERQYGLSADVDALAVSLDDPPVSVRVWATNAIGSGPASLPVPILLSGFEDSAGGSSPQGGATPARETAVTAARPGPTKKRSQPTPAKKSTTKSPTKTTKKSTK